MSTPRVKIQGSLFGPPVSTPDWRKAKRASMKAADEHADQQWREAIDGMIVRLAREKQLFMSYEITQSAKGLPFTTHDLRAIGPAITRGVARGVMEFTGEYKPNPFRHGTASPVWRSLLYQEGKFQ